MPSVSRRLLYLLTLVSLALFPLITACGHGSSNNNTVSTFSIYDANDVAFATPLTTLSMNLGSTFQLNTQAKNPKGTVLFPKITWTSSDTSIVTVSTTGNVCAGTWDSTFVTCTPTKAGTATITATADGGKTATLTVTTHPRITSVTLAPASTAACVSQTKTLQYTAKAFSGSTDVTASAGTPVYSVTDTAVAKIDDKGLATAGNPGATPIFVSFGNVTSTPQTFVTCPPASITLHLKDDPKGTTTTDFSLKPSDTKTLVLDVVDTLGNPITGAALTITSAQPQVASVSSLTLTASNPGFTTIIASCTPPSCNPDSGTKAPGTGIPIYGNLVTVSVSGTSASTVYVTGATGSDGKADNKSLLPIDTKTNTAGTALTLPDIPNSMVVTPNGNTVFIGSASGLIPVSTSSNTVGSQVTNALGVALAVSPDSNRVVLYDAANTRVLVYNVSGASIDVIPNVNNATAAAFSPDGWKLFVAAQGKVYEYVSAATIRSTAFSATPTDVSALPQGVAAYATPTGSGVMSSIATCNNAVVTTPAASGSPSLLQITPDGKRIIAVGSSWVDLAYTVNSRACPPSLSESILSTAAYPGLAPTQLVITSDSKYAFVTGYTLPANTAPQSTLDFYNIVSKSAGTAAIAAGGGQLTSGGVTLDGKSLYVGVKSIDSKAQTNAVHLFDLTGTTPTDTKQINTTFAPEFVVVRPK